MEDQLVDDQLLHEEPECANYSAYGPSASILIVGLALIFALFYKAHSEDKRTDLEEFRHREKTNLYIEHRGGLLRRVELENEDLQKRYENAMHECEAKEREIEEYKYKQKELIDKVNSLEQTKKDRQEEWEEKMKDVEDKSECIKRLTKEVHKLKQENNKLIKVDLNNEASCNRWKKLCQKVGSAVGSVSPFYHDDNSQHFDGKDKEGVKNKHSKFVNSNDDGNGQDCDDGIEDYNDSTEYEK